MDYKLKDWLDRLKNIDDAQVIDDKNKKAILYRLECIYSDQTPAFTITPVSASLRKNGSYGKYSEFRYNPNNLSKYLKTIDYGILSQLYKAADDRYYTGVMHYKLEGRKGAKIFAEILNTGRCFWSNASGSDPVGNLDSVSNLNSASNLSSINNPGSVNDLSSVGLILKLGEPRAANTNWRINDNATQQFICNTSKGSNYTIPTSPAWYIDLNLRSCGTLESKLTGDKLALLLTSPPIAPGDVATASKSLKEITAKAAIALPKLLPPAKLHKVNPIAYLHLTRDSTYIEHQYYYNFLLAELSYDYLGYKISYMESLITSANEQPNGQYSKQYPNERSNGYPKEQLVFKNGEVLKIPYDIEAQQKIIKLLNSFGLFHLEELGLSTYKYPDAFTLKAIRNNNSRNKNKFIDEEENLQLWQEFIQTKAQDLRDQGVVITSDESFPLPLINIIYPQGQWQASIEEISYSNGNSDNDNNNHSSSNDNSNGNRNASSNSNSSNSNANSSNSSNSTDWFDFEIGIYANGKKISLLPILVNLLKSKDWRRELPGELQKEPQRGIQGRPEEELRGRLQGRPQGRLPEEEPQHNNIFTALDTLKPDDNIIINISKYDAIALPAARVKQLLLFLKDLHGFQNHHPADQSLKLTKAETLSLAQLQDDKTLTWKGSQKWQALVEKLKQGFSIAEVEEPKGLTVKLRHYQHEGLQWLKFLQENQFGGILADDMGLGKTIQALAHIMLAKEQGILGKQHEHNEQNERNEQNDQNDQSDQNKRSEHDEYDKLNDQNNRSEDNKQIKGNKHNECNEYNEHNNRNKHKPVLIIAPTSVIFNWLNEIEKFTPSLKAILLHGNISNRSKLIETYLEYDIILSTYPLILRDQAKLEQIDFYMIILDEAQYIKNAQAKITKAISNLRSEHRLCLTGTPMENHLGELWSLFHFIMPGFLGNKKQFQEFYRNPIEKEHDLDRQQALVRKIRPFILRRSKDDVLTELPEKTTIIQYIELEQDQRDLYETIRVSVQNELMKDIAAHGLAKSQIAILDGLLKLRQVCCDPRLVKSITTVAAPVSDPASAGVSASATPIIPHPLRAPVPASAKLEALKLMLKEMVEEKRKILLFSQFVGMLELIEQECQAMGIKYLKLTGESKNRDLLVNEFQTGEISLFLISLRAGGTGLNLTAADTVIQYDPWWNPAVEQQAASRAHRMGQDKPVFVYKLIGKGTVEEKILAMQNKKQALADRLLTNQGTISNKLELEDVERLFSAMV